MDDEDFSKTLAIAMLIGMSSNSNLLTGNVGSKDVGRLLREKADLIVEGWYEKDEDLIDEPE